MLLSPKWAKYRYIIEAELSQETDRGVALIGGALVEDALEQAIKQCLRPGKTGLPKNALGQLFRPGGPLGSFDAKINLAYVNRIVGRRTHRWLLCIKDIRNKFAHSVLIHDAKHAMRPVRFETQKIKDLCGNLPLASNEAQPLSARERFLKSVTVLIAGFAIHENFVRHKCTKGVFIRH